MRNLLSKAGERGEIGRRCETNFRVCQANTVLFPTEAPIFIGMNSAEWRDLRCKSEEPPLNRTQRIPIR